MSTLAVAVIYGCVAHVATMVSAAIYMQTEHYRKRERH